MMLRVHEGLILYSVRNAPYEYVNFLEWCVEATSPGLFVGRPPLLKSGV
jgi:hypothetical protein